MFYRIQFVLVFFLFLFFCNKVSLFPIERVNEKWGFIDKKGRFVIEPQFEWANEFSEGLAAVNVDSKEVNKWGFINKKGKFVIEPKFASVSSFSEGLAAVKVGSKEVSKWGFINKKGKFVIEPKFDWLNEGFSEGLAPVPIKFGSEGVHKWGFINKTGKFVIEPKFDWAIGFSEGLAPVKVGNKEDQKWGFINKTGRFVIEPKFNILGNFSEGLAPVKVARKWSYIDKTGKFVIESKFDSVGSFSEGLAAVKVGNKKDQKWGFINKTGKFVIEPKFDWAIGFSEGLAQVNIIKDIIEDNNFGYIDKTGNVVIEPKFDNVGSFSEGLAPVKVTGKWSYNDKTEKVVIEPKFDYSTEKAEFKEFCASTLEKSGYYEIPRRLKLFPKRYEVERILGTMVKNMAKNLDSENKINKSFSAAKAYIALYNANRVIDRIEYWRSKRFNQIEHLLTNSTTFTQKIAGTNAGLFFGWGSKNIKNLRDIQSDLTATLNLLKAFDIDSAKEKYIYACGVVDREERRFYNAVDSFRKAKAIAIWIDRSIISIPIVLLIFLYFRWKRKREKNKDEKLLRDILS